MAIGADAFKKAKQTQQKASQVPNTTPPRDTSGYEWGGQPDLGGIGSGFGGYVKPTSVESNWLTPGQNVSPGWAAWLANAPHEGYAPQAEEPVEKNWKPPVQQAEQGVDFFNGATWQNAPVVGGLSQGILNPPQGKASENWSDVFAGEALPVAWEQLTNPAPERNRDWLGAAGDVATVLGSAIARPDILLEKGMGYASGAVGAGGPLVEGYERAVENVLGLKPGSFQGPVLPPMTAPQMASFWNEVTGQNKENLNWEQYNRLWAGMGEDVGASMVNPDIQSRAREAARVAKTNQEMADEWGAMRVPTLEGIAPLGSPTNLIPGPPLARMAGKIPGAAKLGGAIENLVSTPVMKLVLFNEDQNFRLRNLFATEIDDLSKGGTVKASDLAARVEAFKSGTLENLPKGSVLSDTRAQNVAKNLREGSIGNYVLDSKRVWGREVGDLPLEQIDVDQDMFQSFAKDLQKHAEGNYARSKDVNLTDAQIDKLGGTDNLNRIAPDFLHLRSLNQWVKREITTPLFLIGTGRYTGFNLGGNLTSLGATGNIGALAMVPKLGGMREMLKGAGWPTSSYLSQGFINEADLRVPFLLKGKYNPLAWKAKKIDSALEQSSREIVAYDTLNKMFYQGKYELGNAYNWPGWFTERVVNEAHDFNDFKRLLDELHQSPVSKQTWDAFNALPDEDKVFIGPDVWRSKNPLETIASKKKAYREGRANAAQPQATVQPTGKQTATPKAAGGKIGGRVRRGKGKEDLIIPGETVGDKEALERFFEGRIAESQAAKDAEGVRQLEILRDEMRRWHAGETVGRAEAPAGAPSSTTVLPERAQAILADKQIEVTPDEAWALLADDATRRALAENADPSKALGRQNKMLDMLRDQIKKGRFKYRAGVGDNLLSDDVHQLAGFMELARTLPNGGYVIDNLVYAPLSALKKDPTFLQRVAKFLGITKENDIAKFAAVEKSSKEGHIYGNFRKPKAEPVATGNVTPPVAPKPTVEPTAPVVEATPTPKSAAEAPVAVKASSKDIWTAQKRMFEGRTKNPAKAVENTQRSWYRKYVAKLTPEDGEKYTKFKAPRTQKWTPEQRQQFIDWTNQKIADRDSLATTRRKAVVREAQTVLPVPAQVPDTFPVAEINLAPERFQYKLGMGEKGVSGSLKKIKTWYPERGQGVSLWRDPANGKVYVVNGHHRVELAQRLGVQDMPNPYFIEAATAEEARFIGAIQNIADGRGTAFDAAKLFRDKSFTRADLEALQLPFTENTVRQGAALANLNPSLWGAAFRGEIPIERAVLIGEKIDTPELQTALVKLIAKETKKGRKLTNDVVSELADMVNGAPRTKGTQATLFGDEAITVSNAIEKAEVLAYIRQQLVRDKSLFGTVSKHAGELERVGNIIQVEASEGVSKEAAQLLFLFDTLKNRAGPVSDIVNTAARRLGAKESAQAVKEETYEQLRQAIPDILGRTEAPRGTGIGEVAQLGEEPPVTTTNLFGEQQAIPAVRTEPVAEEIAPRFELTPEVTPPLRTLTGVDADIARLQGKIDEAQEAINALPPSAGPTDSTRLLHQKAIAATQNKIDALRAAKAEPTPAVEGVAEQVAETLPTTELLPIIDLADLKPGDIVSTGLKTKKGSVRGRVVKVNKSTVDLEVPVDWSAAPGTGQNWTERVKLSELKGDVRVGRDGVLYSTIGGSPNPIPGRKFTGLPSEMWPAPKVEPGPALAATPEAFSRRGVDLAGMPIAEGRPFSPSLPRGVAAHAQGPDAAILGYLDVSWNNLDKRGQAIDDAAKLMGVVTEAPEAAAKQATDAERVLDMLERDFSRPPTGGVDAATAKQFADNRNLYLQAFLDLQSKSYVAGEQEAKRVFFDYRMRNKIDYALDHFVPYHFWFQRFALQQLKYGAKYPAQAFHGIQALKMWQDENANLPASMRFSTRVYTMADGTQVLIKPLNMFMPLAMPVIQVVNPQDYKQDEEWWRTAADMVMGFGMRPGLQAELPTRMLQRLTELGKKEGEQGPLEGLLGPQKDQARSLLPQVDVLRSLAARLNLPQGDPLQQLVYGTDVSGYQDWLARMRLYERYQKGELTESQVSQAFSDKDNPDYKDAVQDAVAGRDWTQALQLVGIPGLTEYSATRQQADSVKKEYWTYPYGSEERYALVKNNPGLVVLWHFNDTPEQAAEWVKETEFNEKRTALQEEVFGPVSDLPPWDYRRRQADGVYGEKYAALRKESGITDKKYNPPADLTEEERDLLRERERITALVDNAPKYDDFEEETDFYAARDKYIAGLSPQEKLDYFKKKHSGDVSRGDWLAIAWDMKYEPMGEAKGRLSELSDAKAHGYAVMEEKGQLFAQNGPENATDYVERLMQIWPDADEMAIRASLNGVTLPGLEEQYLMRKPDESQEDYETRYAKSSALNTFYGLGTVEQRALADQYTSIPKENKGERTAYRNAHPEIIALWDLRDAWIAENPEAAKAAGLEANTSSYYGGSGGGYSGTYYKKSYSSKSSSYSGSSSVKNDFWNAYNALDSATKKAAKKDALISAILDKNTRAGISAQGYQNAINRLGDISLATDAAASTNGKVVVNGKELTDSQAKGLARATFMDLWDSLPSNLRKTLRQDPEINRIMLRASYYLLDADDYKGALEYLANVLKYMTPEQLSGNQIGESTSSSGSSGGGYKRATTSRNSKKSGLPPEISPLGGYGSNSYYPRSPRWVIAWQ